MKRKLLILFIGAVMVLFVVFPVSVSSGAKEGITLWFYTVIPSLLPFMIFSTFMIKKNITRPIGRVSGPFLCRIFSMPVSCVYPAVIGFLSGYPVGAKVAGQMYLHGEIEKNEAQYLLSFCNNASPMFLISYVGAECLHLQVPAEMFLFILLSAFLSSIYTRKKYHVTYLRSDRKKTKNRKRMQKRAGRDADGIFEGEILKRPVLQEEHGRRKHTGISVIEALDESIMDGFTTITKIGGYILLFSILIRLIMDLVPIDHSLKYVGIGFLEITTGGMFFSKATIDPWLKYSIFAGLCAFGGISSVFQTASVLEGTGLSVKEYVFAKLRQCVIAFLLSAGWFLLVRRR